MILAKAANYGVLLLGHTVSSPTRQKTALQSREIPQEHSHDVFLSITQEALLRDNPKNIRDAVFGLVGIQSARAGAGSVTNLDCLRQEIADQAFTNAKAIKDLRLMAGALVYQALEVNTARVGLASEACTERARNPEIGAISQHQDPASPNAAAINRAITLELARRLKGIGADPYLALLSGTFEPGDPNDTTARGHSCNSVDTRLGCIFRSGKLVLDAAPSEVASAVAGISPTFTGTGGIQATDLVDLNSFSTRNDTQRGESSPDSSTTKGLDAAAIVGIVVGGPVVVGILILAGFAWRRRRQSRKDLEIQTRKSGSVYEKPGTTGGFEMDAVDTAVAELPATSVVQFWGSEHHRGRADHVSETVGAFARPAVEISLHRAGRPLSYVSGFVDHLDLHPKVPLTTQPPAIDGHGVVCLQEDYK